MRSPQHKLRRDQHKLGGLQFQLRQSCLGAFSGYSRCDCWFVLLVSVQKELTLKSLKFPQMEPMTIAIVMMRLLNMVLKPWFLPAKMPKSGSMAIPVHHPIPVTKISAISANMGVKNGNVTQFIIDGLWQKLRCFVSKKSLVVLYVLVNLTIRRLSCSSSVLRSIAWFNSLNLSLILLILNYLS